MPRKSRKKRSSSRWRFFRGFFWCLGLIGLLGLLGSFIMRRAVIDRVTSRAISTSASVVSSAFALQAGQNLEETKFFERLGRLHYRAVAHRPRQSGQYRLTDNALFIYTRDVWINASSQQEKQLLKLSLLPGAEVAEIRNVKSLQRVPAVWLEGEHLSYLGNTSTRATSPKGIEEFAANLKNAVVAVEDERFYSHFGLDVIAIARAAVVNLKAGKIVQGGSTLTQQLAKNLFFSPKRTFVRKAIEALSALLIETAFTKDQILELYMNEVFLGQEGNIAIHGFGEAARAFFQKDASDLSLSESATLAGIIRGPSAYSPRRYPKRALRRRNIVLSKLLEQGSITPTQHKRAMLAPLKTAPAKRSKRRGAYFVDYVRRQLAVELGSVHELSQTVVHTGLDIEAQRCATAAVTSGLKRLEKHTNDLVEPVSRCRRPSSHLNRLVVRLGLGWVDVILARPSLTA